MGQDMGARRGLVLALGLLGAGCIGPHRWATPYPERPPPRSPRADLHDVRLRLSTPEFREGLGEDAELIDPEPHRLAFQQLMSRLLEERADLASVTWNARKDAELADLLPGTHGVELALRISADHTRSRTWFFEIFYLGAIFSPAWGEAEVEVDAVLDGEPVAHLAVAASHSDAVLTLFLDHAVVGAYRRAHQEALARVADAVVAELVARRGPLSSGRSSTIAPALRAEAPRWVARRTEPEPIEPRRTEPQRIELDPTGFDLLSHPYARSTEETWLSRYLGALGGVELTAYRGTARVRSFASNARVSNELVGQGEATVTGYRLSFSRPPDRSGFSFPPLLGGFWEDLVLTGFRDDGPRIDRRRGDLAAVATDPATGQPIDLQGPLSYALGFRSLYVGQSIALDLVAGTPDFQLFWSGQAGVMLLEARYVKAQVGQFEFSGMTFVPLGAAHLATQAGFMLPGLHLAVRGGVDYTVFRDFAYPERVELLAARQGPNGERPRTFVESGGVDKLDLTLSVVATF